MSQFESACTGESTIAPESTVGMLEQSSRGFGGDRSNFDLNVAET